MIWGTGKLGQVMKPFGGFFSYQTIETIDSAFGPPYVQC